MTAGLQRTTTPTSAGLRAVGAPAPARDDDGRLLDPLPLLHEEPDTAPRADRDARAGAPALLRLLLDAPSALSRQQLVRTRLDDLGFYSLGYGRYVREGARLRPLSHCTTYANVPWLQRYVCASYHRVDARLVHVLSRALPFIWSMDLLRSACAATPAASLERAFVEDLHSSGSRSGAVLAFATGGGGAQLAPHEVHIAGLASRREGTAWLDDEVLGRALTLTLCLHTLYTRHLPAPDALPFAGALQAALTPTQREVLLCVARGMCDKQIAARLNLSAHTVDYHLRQLRRRFDARNRVLLTQAATRAGLG